MDLEVGGSSTVANRRQTSQAVHIRQGVLAKLNFRRASLSLLRSTLNTEASVGLENGIPLSNGLAHIIRLGNRRNHRDAVSTGL